MCVDADSSIDAKKALQGLDCVLFPPAAFDRCDAAEIRRQISASLPEGFRPDVVFATGWHSRAVRAVVTDAALAATPKVCCLDMPWRWKFRCIAARFVLRPFLRHYDAVYVPGRLAAVYAKWLGFRRIFKGLLSIDVERFSHAEEANERRGFLYVGRFAPEKRLDLLCKVYERYRELGGNWPLDLYGAGDAIPRSSTSAPYLSVHPFVQPDGLPQIYRSHACLLLTSERDAWPLVVLEARASGCEAIVSDHCGNGEELGARRVPFGNVEAMAREMLAVEREWSEGRIRPQAGLANPYAASYDCKAWAKRTLEIAKGALRSRSREEVDNGGHKIFGWCPGMDDPANGMAVVARLLAQDEAFRGDYIVHGMWLPRGWWACLRHFGNYVRMTHGSLSPLYLEHQGKWKKRLVRPIERFLLRHARKVLATCPAEAEWIRAYARGNRVEITDLKRFFALDAQEKVEVEGKGRQWRGHILYLGRRHPLKGVEYLERAVSELKKEHPLSTSTFDLDLDLRIVSNVVGEELEKIWEWCDVLVLPTLSENFGLVVAEALERGKRVVTTDGAPVWRPGNEVEVEERGRQRNILFGYGGRLVYLKGYREGTDEERVELLKRGVWEMRSRYEVEVDSGR